jgi:glucose-1-phosphate adenylyltransferase
MGNYLFKPKLLAAALSEGSRRGDIDFGAHLLPRLVRTNEVVAYDFARNRIPGVQPCEEPAYWRDVGTLEAYRKAQRDVVGPIPRFNLWNPAWPLCEAGCGRSSEGYGERRIRTADLAADELSCVDVL